MGTSRRTEEDVLCYSTRKTSRTTVLRFYRNWRRRKGLSERCDNPTCQFHTNELEWNNQPLPLILDHANGNAKDNTADNLRFLCPNCDSQLPTRGGKNKGRVQNVTDDGYQIVHRDGRKDAKVFLRGVEAVGSVGDLSVTTHDDDGDT